MHPAYSVILFTTLSGAGYGLLIWIAASVAFGLVPAERWFALVGFGLALAMISAGLLASTFHLGRPERAWRAFSQWRTSWLSREGVAAVATYLPSGLLALHLFVFEVLDSVSMLLAFATIVCAVATIYCTGMIYGSLRTIRHWHHPLVPWLFLALALATGAVLFNFLREVFGTQNSSSIWLSVVLLALAAALKLAYWATLDWAPKMHSVEAATGLGRMGAVRPLESAHTQPNFVMREMGYEIGRRHSATLRRLAVTFGFFIPMALLLAALSADEQISILSSSLAVLLVAVGVGLERWLFFAEAQHVVTTYYRGGKA